MVEQAIECDGLPIWCCSMVDVFTICTEPIVKKPDRVVDMRVCRHFHRTSQYTQMFPLLHTLRESRPVNGYWVTSPFTNKVSSGHDLDIVQTEQQCKSHVVVQQIALLVRCNAPFHQLLLHSLFTPKRSKDPCTESSVACVAPVAGSCFRTHTH